LPDPTELLTAARHLLTNGPASTPSDGQLRRAISTAYYALFHKILRDAADRFIGGGDRASASYTILYRAFDHRVMKTVCEEINKVKMSFKYRQCLRRDALSQDMRGFASGFADLQALRHAADYDPSASFEASDVMAMIETTAGLMASFDRCAAIEQSDVLALLMVGARN
jgi:hypothetical protein